VHRRRDPEDVLPLKPKPFLLLLVLQQAGPLHGYAIKKEMRERSGGTVKMDPGGLYRLIARMERDGLVESAPRPADDPDERRQYLTITDWGRSVLAAEARRIAELARMPAVQALAREGRS
jgi:DNA-binding PadR family transcriptional regulator